MIFYKQDHNAGMQHACAMVAGLLDPEARVPHADSQLMT